MGLRQIFRSADTPPYRPAFSISPVQPADGSASRTVDYLDYRVFCARVDALPPGAELHLEGSGDPLLHLHFFQMVRYATERGIRVSAATHLAVFAEYRAEECVSSGLYAMHVLLNAADAWSYRELHGRDCFPKVLRNLHRLAAAKAAARAELPYVYLDCTATAGNLSHLPQLVQLARDENFDGMRVKLDGAEKLGGDEDPRADFHFKRAMAVAERLRVPLQLPKPPKK